MKTLAEFMELSEIDRKRLCQFYDLKRQSSSPRGEIKKLAAIAGITQGYAYTWIHRMLYMGFLKLSSSPKEYRINCNLRSIAEGFNG